MPNMLFPIPVSLEQIGAVIRSMSREEQRRLLEMVPDLREAALQAPVRTESEARESVKHLQQEILSDLGGQFLSPDTPFLGNMTLAEYIALSDTEKAQLWDTWGKLNLTEFKEREVIPDALPA